MAEVFDVVIIGGGPGGYAAALYGANAGLNIAVIEKDKVGGTCLHRGCIPAKEFLETAAVFRTVAGAKEFGVQAEQPQVDFATSQSRKDKVVNQLWKGLEGLMKKRKITIIHGTGTLHASKTVKVDDGTELKAKHVILASGSAPSTIPGFEVDGKLVMTSDEVLALDKLPASVAIVGGGVIGCEFASMMTDLGVQVTILEYLPQLIPGSDKDVAAALQKALKRRGVDIHTGVKVQGHEPNGDGTTVTFGEGEQVTVDLVVVSTGRRPLSETLGLEGTKVELDERKFVRVDPFMRTGEPDVYAVGDVVAVDGVKVHPQLAHAGYAEGMLAIRGILGEEGVPVDYGKVPLCIYTHPEVASAGMTEQQAKDAGIDVVTSKFAFNHVGRAMIIGDAEGFVKLVAEKGADGKAGRLLGVHMIGPWVTELIGQGYLAVNWEATVDEVAAFIQPHPTLAETFGEAVLTLTGRGLHG
ncbi:MAG: dihydrolipoamide dehydrogenase [Actinomycetota bacterium]|jgi:dihydrolipoamide dehydrogenase|nr:dihydrolipoamide dehydrogenase [Actinomycetota bacterium]